MTADESSCPGCHGTKLVPNFKVYNDQGKFLGYTVGVPDSQGFGYLYCCPTCGGAGTMAAAVARKLAGAGPFIIGVDFASDLHHNQQ